MPLYRFTSTQTKPINSSSLFLRTNSSDSSNSLFVEKLTTTEAEGIENTNLCLPVPLFARRWNLTGAIAISRGFQQHPRTSAIFYACAADECDIRLALPNGKKVTLFGLAFRINGINISPVSPESEQIKIELQLSGIHDSYGNPSRHPLDCPVKLKGNNCDESGWRSISDLGRDVGVRYSGKQIHVYVPKNTSAMATTTIRQLLSRAVVNGQFIYYSHPDRVEGRDWAKTTQHIFDMDSYYSVESHRFAGAGYLMPEYKVQLAKEYRNTEINLANIEELEEDNKPKITVRWEFENAKSLVDCQTPAEPLSVGEQIYILKNPTSEILRDPGIAFDVGNFSKTAHRITEENGLETERITKVWGYTNSSIETYTIIPIKSEINGDPNYSRSVYVSDNYRVIFTPFKVYVTVSSAWTEVSSTRTIRKYDSEGYLIDEITAGKKLFRLKQDSSNLEGIKTLVEALELEKQAESTTGEEKSKLENRAIALRKLAESYRFTKTEPIAKKTTYQLKYLSAYFADIVKPWDSCDWIEPRFAHHILTVERRRITEKNPGSTEDFPLAPIVKGKEFREEQKITITNRKKPERFVTTRFVSNAEGEDLEQKIKIAGSSESIGRPSIHQRKQTIEPLPPSSVTVGGGSAFLGQSKQSDESKKYKYLLNSPGSEAKGNIPNGSISFPNVYDVGVARKAAEIQLSIDNTSQAEILTVKALYNPAYQEGDRVVFDEKEYVILGIGYTIEIEEVNLRCDNYTLTLGRLIEPSVTLTRIKNAPDNGLRTGNISGLYAIDGNVTQLKSIYNYLSPAAIAAAIEMGVLDQFLEESNLKIINQEDFSNSDGIASFLNNALGGAGNLDLGSGSLIPEGGDTIDLRNKTPIDKFADLVLRSALINDFNSQLEKLLGKELLESGGDNTSSSGSSDGSGGGGGEIPQGGSLFPGLKPNIILEGGDGFLEGLLNGLFRGLDRLLFMLAQKKTPDGGGGAGGSSGVGGGGGSGGAPGGSVGKPIIAIGDLTIYLPSADFEGLIQMLLNMIYEAIALAKNFDLSLEELLAELLEGASGSSGSGGSGGSGSGSSGSGGSGGGTRGEDRTRYIYPDGIEPATMRIIAPEENLEVADLSELFAALDELLLVLDELANREFDFDLDLEALLQQDQLIEDRNPIDSNQSSSSGSLGTSGSGGTFSPGSINTILVEVVDISGVIGGGVSPLPERGSFGSSSSSSSSASGAGGGITGELSNNDAPLTTGGSIGDSSGLSGDSDYTGDTGEFNFDGWASDGDGFGEDATPFEGTDFSIEPIIPIDPGFYLPTITIETLLEDTENEFVIVPDDFSFTPLYEGNILLITGATASNLVEWELLDSVTGVEILTPFDIEPTIEFNDNYSGDFLRLKLSLRGAPEIFDIVTINTISASVINISGYNSIGKMEYFNNSKVDLLSLIPIPNFTEDGVSLNSVNLYRWKQPN